MPRTTVEEFKFKTRRLIDDINEYQEAKLGTDVFTVIRSTATAMMAAASVIKPEIKIIGLVLEGLGKFLERYSNRNETGD